MAALSTARDVMEVWEKARIPTVLKCHVVEKIKKLFNEWEKLKKNRNNKKKQSPALLQKQESWKNDLEDLFDIAHANALDMIKIDEDREFLMLQRQKGRKGKMAGVDKVLSQKEEIAREKETLLEKKRKRETADFEAAVLSSSSPSSLNEGSSTSDEEFVADPQQPSTSKQSRSKSKSVKLMDSSMLVSLDAAKVSDRAASEILIPAIDALGQNPEEYSVSYSSIQRARQRNRKAMAENLKQDFETNSPLQIHWDGKLIEDITGHENVERLPVLISGQGVDQLLGIPKFASGTGQNIADAVHQLVLEWNISDQVKCMCFDTTASNTGYKSGACMLLEQIMDKDMLWLACRHHIFEIVLEAAVSVSLPASLSPDIQLFKRFKAKWVEIDKKNYQTATDDPSIAEKISDAEEIIKFAQAQLDEQQPRDDYKELLELTLIFLGSTPKSGISFKAPGAYHRARWMAKLIYCIKIWMFKTQFKLTEREERGLRDVCCFSAAIYIRSWFLASIPSCAPRSDLHFVQSLQLYKQKDDKIASAALNKFLRHLWYLSEELVALAFFDSAVSHETKNEMKHALQKPVDSKPSKRASINPESAGQKQLQDFVTANTKRFFEILGLPCTFLEKDAEEWNDDESYVNARDIAYGLKVVNDIAERGVRLMKEYNKLITNDEEQKQYLLQIVKSYRSSLSNKNKKTILLLHKKQR